MADMNDSMSQIDSYSRRLRLCNCIVQEVEQAPDTQVGPRHQQQIQMILMHAGTMIVRIDGRDPYVVPPGQMCILLPGRSEVLAFASGQSTRQTIVRGDPLELTDSMRTWLESIRPTRKLSSALTYLAREAVSSVQTRLTARGALVDALSTALLWRFVAEFENYPAALPEPIELARLFIHQNVERDVTLDDIASAAHVTGPHLIRLFREHMGTTPTKYLWDRRVTSGVELLTSSGLPIAVVAERTGFKTSFHFARKIKEATGQTPSQLRENQWASPDVG